jgi:hypothetical protein
MVSGIIVGMYWFGAYFGIYHGNPGTLKEEI